MILPGELRHFCGLITRIIAILVGENTAYLMKKQEKISYVILAG
jgi:hypothetical protein